MTDTIDKPCIFIVSLGRTGTQFLGSKMSEMIERCYSVHEPDVFWSNNIRKSLERIKDFGLLGMTFGRLVARYSLGIMGIKRRAGDLTDEQIINNIYRMRKDYIEKTRSDVYLEANNQLRSLIDILPQVFPNLRLVFIIRDPRPWVQSYMNKPMSSYSRGDIRTWFRNGRLTPYHMKNDPYILKWKKMTPFQKRCWVWNNENAYALDCIEKIEKGMVFRFEDLFEENVRDETFEKLLTFITTFPSGFEAKRSFDPRLLDRKLNYTKRERFPKWNKWPDAMIKQMAGHCGGLMQAFGYGQEREWLERLSHLE